MTIDVVWPASVNGWVGKVSFLESCVSVALINILPSLLYLPPTTITGNVTCVITIETQNIIIHRPEFVSSSVSGSFLWWVVLCSVPLCTVGALSPVVVVLPVVTLRNVVAVLPAVSTLNSRVNNVKVLFFHTCPLLL